MFVFRFNECFIESKKKKGFIGQASEALILKLVNIAIRAQTMNSKPILHANLFLKFNTAIKIIITNTELLIIGISYAIQEINFTTIVNNRIAVKILVVILQVSSRKNTQNGSGIKEVAD